jgi:hypothetical protein
VIGRNSNDGAGLKMLTLHRTTRVFKQFFDQALSSKPSVDQTLSIKPSVDQLKSIGRLLLVIDI